MQAGGVIRHARAREGIQWCNVALLGVSRHARAREAKLRQLVVVSAVSRHARAREVPPAWGGCQSAIPLAIAGET